MLAVNRLCDVTFQTTINTTKVNYSDEYLVTTPKIGEKYHLAWAAHKGMVWILLSVDGTRAVLMTPRTHKRLTANVSDLRKINSNVNRK